MKKLGKLVISSEKILRNKELITLRGGTNCYCFYDPGLYEGCGITGTAGSSSECNQMCYVQGCAFHSYSGY